MKCFCIFLLLFSNLLFAAEDAKVRKKTFSGKKIKDKKEEISGESSEALREGKKFDIVAEPFGYSVYPIRSMGLTGGYYLRPDAVAELSLAHGSLSFFFFEVYTNVYSARLKKFWGNSFYTNTGLAMREVGGRTKISDILGGSESDDIEVSATSLTADIAIGNKWQFKNFTIGCDWFGLLIPLVKLSTKDNYPPSTPEDREQDKRELERLALAGTAQLVRFYLGASF